MIAAGIDRPTLAARTVRNSGQAGSPHALRDCFRVISTTVARALFARGSSVPPGCWSLQRRDARSSPRPTWGQGRMFGTDPRAMLSGAMTLLWLLIWFVAGHDALTLSPVNAWAATLILAVGLDLARSGVVPGPGSRRGANR